MHLLHWLGITTVSEHCTAERFRLQGICNNQLPNIASSKGTSLLSECVIISVQQSGTWPIWCDLSEGRNNSPQQFFLSSIWAWDTETQNTKSVVYVTRPSQGSHHSSWVGTLNRGPTGEGGCTEIVSKNDMQRKGVWESMVCLSYILWMTAFA